MNLLCPQLLVEVNQSSEQTTPDNNQHPNMDILSNTKDRHSDESLVDIGQHDKCSDGNVANRSADISSDANAIGSILKSIEYVQSDKRVSSEKHTNDTYASYNRKTSLPSVEKPKATVAYKLKWRCTLCTKRTITENQMVEHIDIAHNRKHRYQCSRCNFGDRLISTSKKLFHAQNNHTNEVSEMLCIYTEINDGIDDNSIGTTLQDTNKVKNIPGIVMDKKPLSTRSIPAVSKPNDLLISTQSMPDHSSSDTDEEFDCSLSKLRRIWKKSTTKIINKFDSDGEHKPNRTMPSDTDEEFDDSSLSKRRRISKKSTTKMANVDQFNSDDEYKPSRTMPSDTDEEFDSSSSERRRILRKSTTKMANIDQFDSDDEYKPNRTMPSDTDEEFDSSLSKRRRSCKKSTTKMANVDQFDSDDEYKPSRKKFKSAARQQ